MDTRNYFLSLMLLTALASAAELSSKARSSLVHNFHLNNLEERRARLQHLGELFSGNGTVTQQQRVMPSSTDQQVAVDYASSEPDIEEINEREGIADYLFQSDIHLTDEQLNKMEQSLTQTRSARSKRQVARYAVLWPDNRVYYFFDPVMSARMRTVTQKALAYIQARTCITFSLNATAPNRVRIISDIGCWSSIGMVGGAQELSLGNGCDVVGLAAHEFAHTLGVYHMQMRNDRDDYLTIDLTNVPASKQGNFAKLSADDSINYNPYEYGSVMHYGSNTLATQGNSMIPKDPLYLRTIGSRVISFYDIKTINDHYGCDALCGAGSAACSNGGQPNPRNCAACICPGGYGGALCNQRPPGCGEALVATNLWKVKKFAFGNAQDKTLRDNFMLCNHWISAPAGKQIQIRVTFMNALKCGVGCRVNSIEPKVRPDQRLINPRICCADALYKVHTSALNPTPVISYNRLLTTTFTFHYRYI